MRNNDFLIALLENFSLDKVDIFSSDKLMEGIKSAFGSPGGKFFVAGKLIGLFPEHKRYVEPFIGRGSVLFRKNKEEHEFINDKDEEIYFLFKFMQDITEAQVDALNKMDWKLDNDELNAGKQSLILKFELQKGCYATSLLREFMKSEDIKNY